MGIYSYALFWGVVLAFLSIGGFTFMRYYMRWKAAYYQQIAALLLYAIHVSVSKCGQEHIDEDSVGNRLLPSPQEVMKGTVLVKNADHIDASAIWPRINT